MILVGAIRELVGSHDGLFALELLLVFEKFIVADRRPQALSYFLQGSIVSLGKGMIDLELLGCYQLNFLVSLRGILSSAIFILEVELLSTKYVLEILDQCSLTRVRCTIEPDEVLLWVFSLEKYTVYGLNALTMSCLFDHFYIVSPVIGQWMIIKVALHGLR